MELKDALEVTTKTTASLTALQKAIGQATTLVAESTGALKTLKERLKKDWDANTVKDAEKKLERLKRQQTKLEGELDTALDNINTLKEDIDAGVFEDED